jgi:hypothetical protein
MFSFLKSKSASSSPAKPPEPAKTVAPVSLPVPFPVVKAVSHDQYIQLFNSDGDTVFINLATGFVYWKLPDRITFKHVKYFSHINDEDGKLYFEEASNGKVTWTLPEQDNEISSICRTMVAQIDTMSRSETEELTGISFNEDITNYINDEVDKYLANLESSRNVSTTQITADSSSKESKANGDSEEDDESEEEYKEVSSSFRVIPTEIVDSDYYIQTFNNDGDPLFVGLSSGKAYWILTSNSLFEKLKLVSHINEEDGKLYFEEIDTGNTTWTLMIDNEIVYQAGYDTIYKIDSMTRDECESFVGQRYDEKKIQQQNDQLDNYLEEREEKKKIIASVSSSVMKQQQQEEAVMKRPSSVVKGKEEGKQQPSVTPSKALPVEEVKVSQPQQQQQEKKSRFVEKPPIFHNNEFYIQTFNGDGDTIIVGLTSAIPYWTFPKEYSFDKIRIFSHVNETDGKLYFEDAESGDVTWSLTTDRSIISKETSEMIAKIDNLSREETEILIGSRFNEEATLNQNDEIDEYLTEKDRFRQEEKELERKKKVEEEEQMRKRKEKEEEQARLRQEEERKAAIAAALKKKEDEELLRKKKEQDEEQARLRRQEEDKRRASMKRKEIEQEEMQKKKEKEEEQLRLRRQEEDRRRASVKRKEDEKQVKLERQLEEERIRNFNVKESQNTEEFSEDDYNNQYEEDEDSSKASFPLPPSPPSPPLPFATSVPPPPTAALKLKSTKEFFMQSFNVEGDTVLIGLLSGKLFWKLPEHCEMNDIIYLTHLKEDGRILYEDLSDGSFLWSPPPVKEGNVSSEGHRQIVLVEPMTRDETEHSIGVPYREEVTNSFNDELERHLEHLDEIKKQGTGGRTEEEGESKRKRSSSFTGFNGDPDNALAAMQRNSENQEMFSESLLESNNSKQPLVTRQSRTASLSNILLTGNEEPIIYHDKGNQLKTTVYQVNCFSLLGYFPCFLIFLAFFPFRSSALLFSAVSSYFLLPLFLLVWLFKEISNILRKKLEKALYCINSIKFIIL